MNSTKRLYSMNKFFFQSLLSLKTGFYYIYYCFISQIHTFPPLEVLVKSFWEVLSQAILFCMKSLHFYILKDKKYVPCRLLFS